LWYIATCSEAAEQRFFAFYVSLIGMSIYCLLLMPVCCLNKFIVDAFILQEGLLLFVVHVL